MNIQEILNHNDRFGNTDLLDLSGANHLYRTPNNVLRLFQRADFAEQIEVDRFRLRDEGELDATFVHKDGYEEEFELEYITFDNHVLVWVVG